MRVSVPRESAPGEQRVALTPEGAAKLQAGGFDVVVERGAGVLAGFADDQYTDRGVALADHDHLLADAAAVVRVRKPAAEEISALEPGTVLIGFLEPLTDAAGIAALRERGVVAFAMESIPRITRAQSMDALSSQATISGYKGVLLAADRSPKLFPMLMTAAGTIAPARTLVLGAGVAGLQAIATARRLGAVVSAFDVRPAVAEQVESLGATFLDLGVRGEETEGGYARELTRSGVTIVGLTNVPSLMAADASRLYARNVTTLLEHLAPDGTLALDFDDEITAGACVTGPPAEGAA